MREYRIIIANRPAVHKSAHRPFSKNTKNRVCQLVFFLTVWRIGFTIKHSIIPAVTEPVPMVSTAFFKGIIMNRQFRCGLTEPHFSFDSAKPWFFERIFAFSAYSAFILRAVLMRAARVSPWNQLVFCRTAALLRNSTADLRYCLGFVPSPKIRK